VTVTSTVKHILEPMMMVKHVHSVVQIQDIGWLVSMRMKAGATVSIIQKMTGFAINSTKVLMSSRSLLSK
jgi:hypothetical protein